MGKQLKFLAPGASLSDRERGLAAALLCLNQAGIRPEDAIAGVRARDAWGDSGLAPLHEPSSTDLAGAQAFDDALEAALMACYRGRAAPLDAALELEDD